MDRQNLNRVGIFFFFPIKPKMVSRRFAESVSPNSISPKPFRRTDVSPNGRFTERTLRRMDVSPNGRFTESISPKGNFGQSYHNVGRKIFGEPSVRRNVLSVKRPFVDTACRWSVLLAEHPFGETSVRRNVHSAKRLSVKRTVTEED